MAIQVREIGDRDVLKKMGLTASVSDSHFQYKLCHKMAKIYLNIRSFNLKLRYIAVKYFKFENWERFNNVFWVDLRPAHNASNMSLMVFSRCLLRNGGCNIHLKDTRLKLCINFAVINRNFLVKSCVFRPKTGLIFDIMLVESLVLVSAVKSSPGCLSLQTRQVARTADLNY